MVRDDDRGASVGSRRAHLTARRRRRRRRRLRPVRRRRVRLRRRGPRRLVRLPAGATTRLNRLRLPRDNIQLHPTINQAALSSSVPRLVSYAPAAATAAQYPLKASI